VVAGQVKQQKMMTKEVVAGQVKQQKMMTKEVVAGQVKQQKMMTKEVVTVQVKQQKMVTKEVVTGQVKQQKVMTKEVAIEQVSQQKMVTVTREIIIKTAVERCMLHNFDHCYFSQETSVLAILSSGIVGGVIGAAIMKKVQEKQSDEKKQLLYDFFSLHVVAKWDEFGINLQVEHTVVQMIKRNHPNNDKEACEDMLKRWFRHDNGTGNRPREWSTVIDALKKTGFREEVRELSLEHNFDHCYFSQEISVLAILSSGIVGGVIGAAIMKKVQEKQSDEKKQLLYDFFSLHVVAKWDEFGINLQVEHTVVQMIKRNHPNNDKEACEDMLKRWFRHDNGTGNRPREWSTVIDALKKTGFREVVRELSLEEIQLTLYCMRNLLSRFT
jgi:F0F1-type ATP synthase membrane subunit c/vacuolar-type H+-ATPase subunit K